MKRSLLLIVFMLFLCSFASASLGISPAKKEINFVPGQKIVIQYQVFSDHPDRTLSIDVSGDLIEYATLSKTELKGGGSFILTLDLPTSLDKPGPNNLGVSVKEEPPESQFIGTSINVISPIIINVPYPGKYVELGLIIPDGNVDEQIPIEIKVVNRGKEDLNVDVFVDFHDASGNVKETMTFTPADLVVGDERFFRKFLDTTGFDAGDYIAEAVVKYSGQETRLNDTFRVGSLFVEVVNFTQELPKGGIHKFLVDIEGRWNSDLDEIYADVNLSQGEESIIFRTPSIDLRAWQKTSLTGYLDTDELSGIYKTSITLRYAGQETHKEGLLVIKEGLNSTMIALIVVGVLVLLGIIFAVWRFVHRKKK